ncbi:heterokaryon incompatibility protein [Colletotrichum kahawae]|uniref:Heterokaryon incompatibility protein n=1 Tax=Colletotrichum kahawae TaxID=34407 RepID=A0AAE0DDY6_COLKA|nr:heterokaryon incompatibility protein [Colletotrichum kahawae]
MYNYTGLPASTRKSADTTGDDTAVIEFFRLVYPLNYCDGWKNLFSLTENLTQLLSEEGCVLSSTCSYDPKFESQPQPCCNEAEKFLAQTAELDIRGWALKTHTAVSRCREAGQSCAPRPRALPKRLIQVQNEDLAEEDVRLYQTKEGELGNYVALSYVWGGPQKITTTHSNLAQHLAAISVKSLGKSIRDAITFVRALGIKYVWVDALCIVQDGDKIDEINNMGQIYRDAWLVIAAEASHKVEQGFLQEWPVRRSPTFNINLPNGRSVRAAAQSHGKTDDNDLPSLILAWYDITWEYAGRQLTVWHDRLPALAGVAAQFAAFIGPENYLAGLWKPYIVSQLAWLPAPLLMTAPGQLPIKDDFRNIDAINDDGIKSGSMYLPSATDRDERTTLNPVKADGFATGTYLPSSPAATLARYRKYGRLAVLQSPTWSWCTHRVLAPG